MNNHVRSRSFVGIVLIPFVISFWSTVATAGRKPRCARILIDAAPDFDREVLLDAKRLEVTFKGKVFRVSSSEYYLLHLLIQAPDEVMVMDDLIRGMWEVNQPGSAESTIHVLATRLRAKFRLIDPQFDRIKSKSKAGLYWKRKQHKKTEKGRVAVADHVYEGYADGQAIVLDPTLHVLLTALIKQTVITKDTIGVTKAKAFQITASRLNAKFEPILGVRLINPSFTGTGTYQLNKSLWDD